MDGRTQNHGDVAVIPYVEVPGLVKHGKGRVMTVDGQNDVGMLLGECDQLSDVVTSDSEAFV